MCGHDIVCVWVTYRKFFLLYICGPQLQLERDRPCQETEDHQVSMETNRIIHCTSATIHIHVHVHVHVCLYVYTDMYILLISCNST